MFVWAPIPEPYREMGSLEFSKYLVSEAGVATSPGVGFGPGGDGHVRFALIENEQRIGQAVRHLRTALDQVGVTVGGRIGSPLGCPSRLAYTGEGSGLGALTAWIEATWGRIASMPADQPVLTRELPVRRRHSRTPTAAISVSSTRSG